MHCSFNRIPSLISLVNLRLGFQLSRITPLWALALFQKWSTTIPRDFFFLLSLYIIYYGCLSANEVLGLGHLTAVKLPAKNISQAPPIPTHSYSWGLSSKSSYYWSITLRFFFLIYNPLTIIWLFSSLSLFFSPSCCHLNLQHHPRTSQAGEWCAAYQRETSISSGLVSPNQPFWAPLLCSGKSQRGCEISPA